MDIFFNKNKVPFFIVTIITFFCLSFATMDFAVANGVGTKSPPAKGAYKSGELIVKLKGKTSSQTTGVFFSKISGKMSLKASFGAMNLHHFSLKTNQTIDQAIADFKTDPNVEYAEPNYLLSVIEGVDKEQAQALTEIDVSQLSQTFSQNRSNVKVSQAWDALSPTASDRPIVAVIDTGVDYTHNVFVNSQAIWSNTGEIPNNHIDDDGNGYIDDVNGWNFASRNNNPMDDDDHGTHVAGIILGVGLDIFSTAALPQAKIRIMPLKFLSADGSGTTSDAISAIYYAVQMGAQVINNSWGGSNYSQALHDALSFAYGKKVLIVAASGNQSSNNDASPLYPANYPIPSLISIAATNDSDLLAAFSNYGLNNVHVASPGVGIRSTVPGNAFRTMSGTSMAAPFVSGLAGLTIREAPALSGYQVKNLILNSADRVNSLQGKIYTSGRVNVYESIMSSKGEMNAQSYQPDYSARSYASESNSSVSMGGCGLVINSALQNSSQPPNNFTGTALLVAFSLLPLIVWYMVRARSMGRNRRRHERFVMNSDIKIKVGERELVGQLSTISLGGLSFHADTMLEKGGLVTMQITGPDGREQVQVQGQIVWSEQNSAYGVQFQETKDKVLDQINHWTDKLVKAN